MQQVWYALDSLEFLDKCCQLATRLKSYNAESTKIHGSCCKKKTS